MTDSRVKHSVRRRSGAAQYACSMSKSSLVLAAVCVLAACTTDEQTELRAWMKQQRDKTPTSIAPVTAPTAFVPVPYGQASNSDPFDEQKLKSLLAQMPSAKGKASGVPGPDLSRRREPLEAFPLEGIKMMGFVLQQGKPAALVQASGALYHVKVGQYIGQDFGKISAINEQEISIKELIQDASGSWADRVSKLPLFVVARENKK